MALDTSRAACCFTRRSLPGRFGIGDLGPSAIEFLDLLAAAGQRLWQVLPLGPDRLRRFAVSVLLRVCRQSAAHQPRSADRGRPARRGDAPRTARRGARFAARATSTSPPSSRHRQRAVAARARALRGDGARRRSRDAFDASAARRRRGWTTSRSSWRSRRRTTHRSWTTWEPDIARREPAALRALVGTCARATSGCTSSRSSCSSSSGSALRDACRARGIAIMGDLPIFVAHDSADVWASRELFRLDADGSPTVVAGVPPDYFSATGQLWGNPHYRWDVLEQTGYAWWIERFRAVLRDGRSRAHRSLPRLRRVVGGPGRRDDGRRRAVGEGPGRRVVPRGASGAGRRPAAVRRREPRRDHAGGRGAARAVRPAGHGDPAVRVRHRSAGARLQAAQLPAQPRRLHRDARQRHDRRLVDRRRRPQHAHRATEIADERALRAPLSRDRRTARSTGTSSAPCSRRWPTPRSFRRRICSASAARRA